MTEAVSAIIEFGFEKLNASVIEACYAIWNRASEKVLKRNGMKYIKHVEKGYKKKGQWVAENIMAIEKEEWKRI